MSPSAFREHFRAVRSLTPLQFLKQLRLIEARRRRMRMSGLPPAREKSSGLWSCDADLPEPQPTLSPETPVHPAARLHHAGHLPPKMLLQRWLPRHQLESQSVVDHREPA